MPDSGEKGKQAAETRKLAEKRRKAMPLNSNFLSREEGRLLQELQVHQIELEMQNEELLRVQQNLEESRSRYFNLYDIAPVGYLTIDEQGTILEANQTAANMLGDIRSKVIKKPLQHFIFKDDQDQFYTHFKEVLKSVKPGMLELRMLKNESETMWASLWSSAELKSAGFIEYRITICDISERKRCEEETIQSHNRMKSLLKLSQLHNASIQELRQFALTELIGLTGSQFGSFYQYNETENELIYKAGTEPLPDYSPEKGIWGETVQKAEPVIINKFGTFQRSRVCSGNSGNLLRFMTVPVFSNGHIVGVIGFGNKETDYDISDVGIISQYMGTAWNIISRRNAEELLEKSELHYRLFFENMMDGFAHCRMLYDDQNRPVDFIFLKTNHVFDSYAGLDNLTGKRITEVFPEIKVLHPGVMDMANRVVLTGKSEKMEVLFKPMHLWLNMSVYGTEDGCFAVIFDNINDRIKSKEELLESEERLKTIMELTPVGIGVIGASDGNLLYVNNSYRKLFGYSDSELLGHLEPDLYWSREEKEKFLSVFQEKQFVEEYEIGLKHRDGTLFWGLSSAHLITFQGRPAILGTFIDISRRKNSEAALKLSEEKYAAIYENSPFAISLTNPSGIILSVNDSFQRLFGYSREEVIGKTSVELNIADEESQKQVAAEMMKNGFVRDFECERRTKDEVVHHFLINLSWITIGEGKYILTTSQDITDRKIADEAFKKSKANLARSNKDLEQFAYAASHDLQEPLRAVTGFVSLLKEEFGKKLDPKKTEYLKYIEEGAARMKTLINGLLEYSRIHMSGKELKMTDSGECLNRALLNLKFSISETSAVVKFDRLPMVFGEPFQLELLFQNLVSNAIKFHSEARPVIHITAEHENELWKFAVRDNGIGIEKEHQDRVFLIFQRLHTRDKYPGTGIGLAICRKIVERHNGRIWIEPNPENGVTFYFTLPNSAFDFNILPRREEDLQNTEYRRRKGDKV